MYRTQASRGAKSSTDALLQRVSSQLRGRIIQDGTASNEDDDDDINAYLRSLSKKKTGPAQLRWDKYDEESDFSPSDHEVFQAAVHSPQQTASSKFLKKKQPIQQTLEVQEKSQHGGNTSSRFGDKKANYTNKRDAVRMSSRVGRSILSESDSDLDMNLSMDEDVLADVKAWKEKNVVEKGNFKAQEGENSSPTNVGSTGKDFLKKRKPALEPRKKEKICKDTSKKGRTATSWSGEHSEQVILDISEDSASDMYERRSQTSKRSVGTSGGKPKLKSSLQTPQGQNVNNSDEDDIYPTHGQVYMAFSDDSNDESVKLNIMELNDLKVEHHVPKEKVTVDKKIQEKDEDTSASDDKPFNLMQLQTVEDLLGAADELSAASEVKTEGVTSEIRTELYEGSVDTALESSKNCAPLKSILATPRSPKTTPRSARGRVRYSLEDDIKIRSRSPSPEVILTAPGSEMSSVIHTECSSEAAEVSSERSVCEEVVESGTEPYSEDYSEDFSSPSGRSSPERSSRSSRRRYSSDHYSDDFTDVNERTKLSYTYSRSSSQDSCTDNYTSYSESCTSRTEKHIKQRSRKRRNRKIQTGLDMGLLYHWNPHTSGSAILGPQYGMAFVDPTPIATHVVSAEALEAVTGYSPSVIALNDMLRQQLMLTTHFLETQKRLYDNYANILTPDCHYTTLADTKKYIKKNKRKVISFDEALKQVKAEMGLK